MVLLRPRFRRTGRRRAAHRLEQREVLRVARADLEHVGVLGDHLDIGGGQDLGHDRQPRLGARIGEVAEAVEPEAAEGIRRGPRLEGAAAEHRGSCGRDLARGRQHLLAGLDRTRTGDHDEGPVTKSDAGDIDHGGLRMPLPRHLLVRLAHRDRVDDTRQIADRVTDRARVAAEDSDREAVDAGELDRLEAPLADVLDDVRDLLRGRLHVHEDQHRQIVREGALSSTSSR